MLVSVIIIGGAGRMGSALTRLALDAEDLELAAIVERPEQARTLPRVARVANDLADLIDDFPGAVVIDFTTPECSLASARLGAKHGNPVVIGTTGVSAEQKAEMADLAVKTPLFLSPNMSLGINVLLAVLPNLVSMLEGYDLELMEMHHRLKRDAPSGTALRLAEVLAEARGWTMAEAARLCREGMIGERPDREIGVQTLRGGDVVGVHTVYCMGPGERIEITHHAHSRDNFANGALRAARWLARQKPGPLYDMSHMLGSSC